MFDRRKRKWINVLTVFALLFSVMLGLPFQVVQANSVLTVGQAIANNTGKGTVEGYIVAHTTSGSGGIASYKFEAPFANDFNFALADSPTERDKAKLLPVQIPANFRTTFALQTNPTNIGKKVRVAGDLKAYFTVPGLQSPSSIEFIESSTNPDPTPEEPSVISLAEARGRVGQTVIIQGVVTADNAAIGGGRLSTYIQDEMAGINLFAHSLAGFPDLKEGDLVKVKGRIEVYNGLTEVVPAAGDVEVLEQGKELPEAKATSISLLNQSSEAEPLEGKLVKLTGYVQNIPSSPAGGGYNVTLVDDKFQSTTLRVMVNSLDIELLEKGKWYEITGILSQYNSYQLIPRKASDLVLLDHQLPEPSAAGEYEAIVASVTDGDTIRLTAPVLGASNVRFLNIDTAETYHTPKNEADQNQKDLGEKAKQYLNTLLKAGDQVVLKVGSEPTDSYGRLLAEVIRKSDGLNTNLEMVEKGHAVTYFIWPIGEDYEVYSQAVKRASDAKLGIWNETEPLMELPFVFRAREQGREILRPVGNYFTKKYVAPEAWTSVPVEARVFFDSNQEAEANGYVPANSNPEPVPQEAVKVKLLGVNDWHGKIDVTSTISGIQYGRADYLAAYLRQRKEANPNTLLIHSGDMVGGSSPVSKLLQEEPTVQIMNAMGFDVGTVGNHEFDAGVEEMLRLIHGGDHPNGTENYQGMNFPLVAANVEYKDTGKLVLDPYVIKEVGGVPIGFIGVATKATPSMVMPTGITTIRFTDEATAINKFVPELQARGVEAIVVLAHVPGEQDGTTAKGEVAEMAKKVNDAVDIILAAHNHVKVNAMVGNKLIVQAWEYGNAFADIDIEIDPVSKDIVKKSAEIVDVVQQNIQPDPVVGAILNKYLEQIAPKVNQIVGTSEVELLKGYPTKGIFGDMALGNFIADGMRWSMQADFALMNGGGVRDNIDVGPITWGELFNVQPFGNTLVKIEVTGQQFIEILNAMINPAYGPDSFISGASYTFDPVTNKVVRVVLENGQSLDLAATYSLVVNNYMYYQTSAKYRLLGLYGKNVEQGPEDIVASVDYVMSLGEPVRHEAEGRISTDLTAPVTEVVVEGQSGEESYNQKEVQITFSATDAGVGVARMEYRVNNGEWKLAKEGMTVNEEGRNLIEYRSVDRVGNQEAVKSLVILLDKTAPVIEAPDQWSIYRHEAFTFTPEVTDQESGVKEVVIRVNGVKTAANSVEIGPLELSVGQHTITVTATDHAGHQVTKEFTLEVIMDVQHLDELVQTAITHDISKSLLEKVEAAQSAENEKAKANILEALQNQIKAQSGKSIEKELANQLIKDIQEAQQRMSTKTSSSFRCIIIVKN
ncbi:5'-nucleotidase C-terminal domain-containing protein [Ammoniphilus sp. YIM 78166]|uniref:5'-nucleotidase C-terminal domain-containing protein n=1 Tax=Ammoniphilus sp. YIM 78166 TaxID=1644106 RepID=UPI0010700469|nr:5'-nucleotidase C-terminal domain-containing protein [Ammoniphilus sp. YIM 78166]